MQRQSILDKPKTVTVNFRSHSGILNTAAAVLRHLFDTFPASAKEVKADRGLFSGPHPSVFSRISYSELSRVARDFGVVVLTQDSNVLTCKDALNGYPLAYGTREAKGLEFRTVLILDFFGELPKPLQSHGATCCWGE